MESLHELGLALIRLFQESYPQLRGFFLVVAALGQEEFYLAVMPLIYWCVSKSFGKQLGYLLLMTVAVNAIAKQTFRWPRPYWIDRTVMLDTEPSYGMPSGHAQYATALLLFTAAQVRRRWAWGLAILAVLIVSAGRVYLGVHFPTDVVGGLVLGLLLLAFAAGWWLYFAEGFSKRILGQKLLVAVAVPIAVGLVYVVLWLIIGPADRSVPWKPFIPVAERNAVDTVAAAVGSLLGFGAGAVLEGSRVRFRTDGPIWQRALRYIVGMAVALTIWEGMDRIFPDDPLWLAIPLRIIRYFLLLLWIAYYAPMVFVRLRLATADPPPEISMKM
jgi:membrane-associated phospholipid phosphatase